jgi:interferon gamma-inducible protein 30
MILTLLSAGYALTAAKLRLRVFEESLCPDSRNLMTGTLGRAVATEGFLDMVDLAIVPFGNANYTFKQGVPEFACQHGPEECMGNKVHLCSMKVVGEQQQKRAQIVACHFENAFKSKNFTDSTKICAEKFGVDGQ